LENADSLFVFRPALLFVGDEFRDGGLDLRKFVQQLAAQ
jgi:hypothetical protein